MCLDLGVSLLALARRYAGLSEILARSEQPSAVESPVGYPGPVSSDNLSKSGRRASISSVAKTESVPLRFVPGARSFEESKLQP